MEKHTTAFNNVHTQLLLEIHIKSNIQEMKDQVLSTQNELHATKAKLATANKELHEAKTNHHLTQKALLATQTELEATKEKLTTSQVGVKTANQNKATALAELETTKASLASTKREMEQAMKTSSVKTMFIIVLIAIIVLYTVRGTYNRA